MPKWESFDPNDAFEKLGPDLVKSAREHAAESIKRTKILMRLRVPSGRVLVTHGPLIAVSTDGTMEGVLPASATPSVYMITWMGHPGSDYPPIVDNNVLMQADHGRTKGQVWAVESAADAVRIIKAAFGLNVHIPEARKS